MDDKKIKDYENYSSENNVEFHITFDTKIYNTYQKSEKKLLNDFKLENTLNITNMYLFDKDYKLKKYQTTLDILQDFYDIRIEYYQKRKEYMLEEYEKELETLYEKIKFIEYVMDDKIKVFRQKKENIIQQLEEYQFKKIEDTYDHLLKIPLYQFTYEKIEELNNQKTNKEKEYKILLQSTKEDLWKNDLNQI